MLRKLLRVLGIVLAAAIVIGAALLLYLEPYVTYDRDGAHLSLKKNAQDPDGTGATAALPEVSDAQIVYDEAQPGSNRIADLGGVYVTTQMLRDPEAVRAALEQQGACAVLLQLKSTFGNFYYSSSIDGAELTQDAAQELTTFFSGSNLMISFETDDTAFPADVCTGRLYIRDVDGSKIEKFAQAYGSAENLTELVFLVNSKDTRFDERAVLRLLLNS